MAQVALRLIVVDEGDIEVVERSIFRLLIGDGLAFCAPVAGVQVVVGQRRNPGAEVSTLGIEAMEGLPAAHNNILRQSFRIRHLALLSFAEREGAGAGEQFIEVVVGLISPFMSITIN